MQCPGLTRREWRSQLLEKIHRLASTPQFDPILADILRDGLQRWLQDLSPIPLRLYPTAYHPLILSQTKIGWSHIVRGRWSYHWRDMQSRFACRQESTYDHTRPNQFIQSLGTTILQAWFELWAIRNKERHGRDEIEQKEKRSSLLRTQLEALYRLRPLTMPVHRHIFMTDAATHISERPNLDGLEDWINTFGPAISSSVQQATANTQPTT